MDGCLFVFLHERTAAATEGGTAVVSAASLDVILGPQVASVGHLVNALEAKEG